MFNLKRENIIQKIKESGPYLAVVAAIVLPWFFKSGYLFFTDFSWGPNTILNWANGWLAFNIFVKILSFFFSFDLIQKLVIAITILIVLLGGKKIAENFIEDKRLVFAISLFALFNPFVYDRLMYGQVGTVLAFGFFGLAVGYLWEYLGKRKDKQILSAGLFTALSIQFSMHFIFFVGLFWILFGAVLAAESEKKNWRKILKNIALAAVIVLSLNFNWLFGMFIGSSSQEKFINSSIQRQDLIAFQTSGKTGSDALKNVVMMSGFWGKDQFRYIDITRFKENWGRSFFLLLPIILLGAATVLKKRREGDENNNFQFSIFNFQYLAIGLIIIYAIAVILAVGIRLPAAREITIWLFDNFPFYKGLREPQKWVAAITVIYTIFLSIGVRELFKIKIIEANRSVASFFLGAIIVMQAPLMIWGYNGQVSPTAYPKDWEEADTVLKLESFKVHKAEKCEDRILFLPWHMYMSFNWIGRIVASPARNFFSCPVIVGTNMEWGGIYDNSQSEESDAVAKWLVSGGKTDLLSDKELNIRYIILAKELEWKNYLEIEKNPELELVKDSKTLKVYKVK